MSATFYDDSFYKEQIEGSYRSALIYVNELSKIFKPDSVADLGCGRGTWLKAFLESGSKNLVGFDGDWNSQEKMIDQAIKFIPTDLNKPIDWTGSKFDLSISLEVAEHLKPNSSKMFVQNLTSLADVVVFGAAYENQGGTDHINEQKHSYWANIFLEFDYLVYDFFRPATWGNQDVEFWYQQNTFLYIHKDSKINQVMKDLGCHPIKNIEFMNCINPHIYEQYVSMAKKPLKTIVVNTIKAVAPKSLIPFIVRIKRKLKL